MADVPLASIAGAFLAQSALCAAFDAPLYAELCRRCAGDVQAGGPVAHLVGDWRGDPRRESLSLRLLAGVHARVLAGEASELGAHYPSVGGVPRWPAAWAAFAAEVESSAGALRPWLKTVPQTNAVGRAAALLPGFLCVAEAGLPMAVIELGASAGLLLRFDRYRYRLGGVAWGDPASAVPLEPRWQGASPPTRPIAVAERRGCDLAPIDVRTAAGRLRQLAYVWADRVDRLRAQRAAMTLAAQDALVVERADAVAWLPEALREVPANCATVVFHSSFWAYVSDAGQRSITSTMTRAGAQRTPRNPLFWLRWEDEESPPRRAGYHELRLRSWPGGDDRLLARGQPHGDWIEWLG